MSRSHPRVMQEVAKVERLRIELGRLAMIRDSILEGAYPAALEDIERWYADAKFSLAKADAKATELYDKHHGDCQ